MFSARSFKFFGRFAAVSSGFAVFAFAVGRQDLPKLKIGERLMDGPTAIKAADFKTGAELFQCSEEGCVAIRAGSFTFNSAGAEKANQVLTPSVRVIANFGGKTKELAANLAFDKDLVAKVKAPVGAKILLEPVNFVDGPKPEIGSLAVGAETPVKLPSDYIVEVEPVLVKVVPGETAKSLSRGQRAAFGWNIEGGALLPDEARVEIFADSEAGKSPVAFRKPMGRWQDRLTDQPLSGGVETMFLTSGSRKLHVRVKVGDQIVAETDPLGFSVAEPKLRLELKNVGRRVGDMVNVAAFSDDQPLAASSLVIEPGTDGDGRVPLTDSTKAISARYRLFQTDDFDENGNFAATEIRMSPVPVNALLPQIQTVSFKNGVSAQVEPARPTVLPVVLRSGEREIDADPADLQSFEIVQDPPGTLSTVKVVTTGSSTLGLSFTGQKPGTAASLTVKYRGREIATLIVQVDQAAKSGRLSGKFLPLNDEDVTRIYGDEVAKTYHVVECTLTNTVPADASDGKYDVIVQPEGIEFGAVVQSRGKKGDWRIASANATSGAILPGGSMGTSGFTIGGVLNVEALKIFFQNANRGNAPSVVKLLAKHLPRELPDDQERWASALNTAVTDMADSLDWSAFATAYGYSDSSLQSMDKERLIRRRLQIDTNEAAIGSEFNYVRWRPLSPEAVNEVFQVLSRQKKQGRSMQVAQLFLSAGKLLGNVGLMGDGGKGIMSGLGAASNLLPTIKQTLPELSDARRRTLASMLFAGPLRLSPQLPTKKHIFISKEVMKYMFNADETRISEIVQGSMTADVAIVTSSERTTIGSSGG
jgi:hypothetical protein